MLGSFFSKLVLDDPAKPLVTLSPRPNTVYDIALTTAYARRPKLHDAEAAWHPEREARIIADEVGERGARSIEAFIDDLRRVFERREFSAAEDVMDGSDDALSL